MDIHQQSIIAPEGIDPALQRTHSAACRRIAPMYRGKEHIMCLHAPEQHPLCPSLAWPTCAGEGGEIHAPSDPPLQHCQVPDPCFYLQAALG